MRTQSSETSEHYKEINHTGMQAKKQMVHKQIANQPRGFQ